MDVCFINPCYIQGSSIEWSRRDAALPRRHTTYGGVLMIESISAADAGYYICRASNQHGVTEMQAYVNVQHARNGK